MIDRDLPYLSDALYWRAYNLRTLRRLPEARQDIERAKRLAVGRSTLTLAGVIEYEQEDYGPAEIDLTRALKLADGSANCEGAWYLGLVYMKREAWASAAPRFEAAVTCYQLRRGEAEQARRTLDARMNVDADFKARQMATLDASIKESISQRAAAAYNAASVHAQLGDLPRARSFVEIAATDESLSAELAALRTFLASRER
jgi:tetratricopeptide (TPR) repeat protein